MSEFQEDMIFKEVSEEDARIFLDILGKKSKKVKIMTTELRQLDPTTFVPDIILELDDEILIIELQSTKVGKNITKDSTYTLRYPTTNLIQSQKKLTYVFLPLQKNLKKSHMP